MKSYEIIDTEEHRSVGILLYYEKKKDFIIELQENLNEWTAPLLFTNLVKKGIYTVPRDLSFLWIKERIIPSGRQNISSILKNHKIICFFEDGAVKKVDLQDIESAAGVDKVLRNESLYQSCQVGTGGYCITFDDFIDVPACLLYDEGMTIPLSKDDFISFARNNLLDTTESCAVLECSRQNISYMVKRGQLEEVKVNVKGNLYQKGDILRNMW